MKKIIYSVALIAFVSFLFSCEGNSGRNNEKTNNENSVEEIIIGTWKIEEVKIQNISELADQIFDDTMAGAEMETAEINQIKKEIKDDLNKDFVEDKSNLKEIVFKADNKMTFGSETGEWAFGEDKTFVSVRFNDREKDFEINEINAETFDFTIVEMEDGYEFRIQMICKK